MTIYSGIGTRQITAKTHLCLQDIGEALAKRHWLLRSGGASGCDQAFEAGCDKGKGKKEIFLPWKNFEGNPSKLFTPSPDAFELAARIHPAWGILTQGGQKLHARNCHQVLGADLVTPVHIVICFTPGGAETGGTSQAIRLARENSIPVLNLGTKETWTVEEVLAMLEKVGA